LEARYSYFGRVYLERNYTFCALLGSGILDHPQPRFEVRGFPHDANVLTSKDWLLTVREEETDRERYVVRQEAEQWVQCGASQWVGTSHITDPDFYRPSWLLLNEMEQVYSDYLTHDQPKLTAVEAALAAMQSLPEARMVYWFW